MSKITIRDTAPRDGGSVENRLARLLDAPFLARVVPHLPPETLHQLIRSRGLAACGELVTSATPAQLTSLLDLDLWRPARPGRDGQFDVDRFGEWLDVLVDSGDSVAARVVAAVDKDLVILGLSRYLRIFDQGTFEPTESSDDEPIDRNDKMKSEQSGDGPCGHQVSGVHQHVEPFAEAIDIKLFVASRLRVAPQIEVEQGGELRRRRTRDELAARIESAVLNELMQRLRREVRDDPREEWRVQETREPMVHRAPFGGRCFAVHGCRHGLVMIPVLGANKQS